MSYKVIKRYRNHVITELTGVNCLSYKVINNLCKSLRNSISPREYYNFITRVLKQKENPLYFPSYKRFYNL